MRRRIPALLRGAVDARWRNLIAAIACVVVFDVTLGFSFPVVTLILEARGTDESVIGLNAAMTPIGLLLFGPMIPAVTRRFGSKRVAIASALAISVLLLAMKAFPSLPAWFLLRIMLGATAGTLFAISEAWVVRFSEGPDRGLILAIYASLLSAGFALGPIMIPFTGISGWLPFVVAAGTALVAMLPIPFVTEPDAPPDEDEHGGFLAFLPKAPVLLMAVGVFAVFDAALMTFLPVYGLRNGLDLDTASFALGVLIGGNVILQIPIGLLADRWSRPGMMLICAVTTAVACAFIPATIATPLMWPVLIIAGAAGFGIYTVALALLGDRFSGNALVAGAAAFAVMWGVGAVIGSPVAAGLMKLFGDDALLYFMTAVYLAYAAAFAYRQMTRHRAVPATEPGRE